MRYELPDGRVLLDDVSFRVGDGREGRAGRGQRRRQDDPAAHRHRRAGAARRCGDPVRRAGRDAPDGRSRGRDRHELDRRRAAAVGRPAAGARGRGGGRPARAGADGRRRRGHPDGLRHGALGVRRRRRLRHRGRLGHLLHRGAGRRLRPGEVPRPRPRSAAASRSGWCWSTSSPAPTRCCCSTSPTTSSTCPARSGSSSGSASRPRRSCSSATTASCWPTPRPGWSPSSCGAAGNTVWTHPGGFASYHQARSDRFARFEELHPPLGRGARQAARRWC